MTLKEARERAKLNLRQAADKLGVYYATLSRWELGIHYPTVPFILEIEKLYGVKFADIDWQCKEVE